MVNTPSFEEFARIFEHNLRERSRTAKGISDTSSSSKKKPLLKSGADLEAQVAKNTGELIKAVWESKGMQLLGVHMLRGFLERWDDIINTNLQPSYREEHARLLEEAVKIARTTGRILRVNRHYRTWNVGYTTRNIVPLELEFAMDKFYGELHDMMMMAKIGRLSQAQLLAFADLEVDGEIRPWADGCGRNATATVMWLSLLRDDWKFPVFGSREEHYANIRNLDAHTRYYERCFERVLSA